jgi:hypothetical protein
MLKVGGRRLNQFRGNENEGVLAVLMMFMHIVLAMMVSWARDFHPRTFHSLWPYKAELDVLTICRSLQPRLLGAKLSPRASCQ